MPPPQREYDGRQGARRLSRDDSAMLLIDMPTLPEFKALAEARDAASVSLFLPTLPQASHARVNRIAFKDLAKTALLQLVEAGTDKPTIEALEQQFDRLAGSDDQNVQDEDHIRKRQKRRPSEVETFWKNQAHGLAVLATPGMLRTFDSRTLRSRSPRSPTAST